jgi:hypothetical protein
MSAIKNFYHEEICNGMQEAEYDYKFATFMACKNRNELSNAFEKEAEDAQIIVRAEEMKHSEMPNFLR